MNLRRSTNLDMLAVVAKGLKGLKERVVFVGGATIELYVAASTPEGRATDDVDCVVEMASRVNYYMTVVWRPASLAKGGLSFYTHGHDKD